MQPRQEDARRSDVGALTENKARTFAFRFVLNIKTALRTTGSKWHTYSTSTRFQTHLCPWRHAADRGLSLYANTHCVTRRPSTGDRMPSSLSLPLSRPLFLLVRCSAVFSHETHPRVRLHKRTQDTYTPSSRLISARFDRTQAISTGVDSGRCLTPVLCWIIDDYIGVSRDRDRGLLTLTA